MNTKVALADDYSVTWYTASNNPVRCTGITASFVSGSLDDAYQVTLSTYGYVDYIINYNLVFNFTGFTNGYSYKLAPYGNFLFSMPANMPLTGFEYDSVDLVDFAYGGNHVSSVDVYFSTGSTIYLRSFGVRFLWDWFTAISNNISVPVNLSFRVRAYGNASADLSLYALGQLYISGSIGNLTGGNDLLTNFTNTGAWIANFNMMQGSASQFNNSSLMAGYLYDIRNALIQSPDTDYTAAIDSAQSALDTEQNARDDVFQQVDQFYMTDADTLLTLDDIDSNVGVGLDFWFDWVNAYFNKADEVDANKPLTLNIIFNFISRLF